MSCSCNEFTRAAALRRTVAEAGRGLPTIEPGMPIPAGTGLDRRNFLASAVGLALSVYGAGKLPLGLFEEGIARAQSSTAPILVSVFLEGGADSLSMLFPAGNAQYVAQRPQLALSPTAESVAVHGGPEPLLAPLARAHRRAPRRGQGHRRPRHRLHERRPVALHVAPLLRGRRDRRAPAHRLARPLPRRGGDARQPAPGPGALGHAPPLARVRQRAHRGRVRRWTTTTSGHRGSGARSRPACSRRSAPSRRWPTRPPARSPR